MQVYVNEHGKNHSYRMNASRKSVCNHVGRHEYIYINVYICTYIIMYVCIYIIMTYGTYININICPFMKDSSHRMIECQENGTIECIQVAFRHVLAHDLTCRNVRKMQESMHEMHNRHAISMRNTIENDKTTIEMWIKFQNNIGKEISQYDYHENLQGKIGTCLDTKMILRNILEVMRSHERDTNISRVCSRIIMYKYYISKEYFDRESDRDDPKWTEWVMQGGRASHNIRSDP